VAKLSQGLIALPLLAAGGSFAQAPTLHIEGVAGYLSEWELSADVAATGGTGGEQFSGPLSVKHVGLCSPSGLQATTGKIELRVSRSIWRSELEAVLVINGARCSYRGALAGGAGGFMDCSDGNGIPLTLSARP
jgi:hypothetical protein